MSYIEEVCNPLITTLERTLSLPSHQFAGHAANLDFWMNEAEHRLNVLDGYAQRFERMKKATQEQGELVGKREMPMQRGIQDQDRKELRQKVSATANRFLERCRKELFVDEEMFDHYRDALAMKC